MTTTLHLPDGASTYTTALGRDVVFERTAPGQGGTVRGLKVFRAGKFRDSANRPHEWASADLHNMVSHFIALRDNGIFVDVPVRANHGRNVGDVVGYISNLSTDGKFLIADLEITEPHAADKIERKSFRSRSLEVGAYRDNDDKVYSPAVLGVAFVDIGAVEGLFNSAGTQSINFTITEQDMTTFEQSQLDWAVAAAYAKGLEDAPKPTPPSDLAPFEFTYGGAEKTSDPKVVQAYISTLETAQAEQRDASRKNYVTALATGNKISATQIDATQALVLTMSDAQFEAYRTINDGAPKLSTFEQHSDNGNGTGEPPAAADQELKDLEEIVAMHRRTGMDEEVLSKTASFQKLVALKNASN